MGRHGVYLLWCHTSINNSIDGNSTLTLSRKDLESIICIACGKRYGEHTKGNGTKFNLPSLMTCMFRIQGTVVADGINNEEPKPSPPVDELDYDC